MRLFMVTKSTPPNQVGDSSASFALSTFFPEKAHPTIDWIAKVCYKAANLCKVVDACQSCIRSRQVANAKAKAENRKKALEMLQNEIDKKEDDCDDNSGDAADLEASGNSSKDDKDSVSPVKKRSAAGKDTSGWKLEIEEGEVEKASKKRLNADIDMVNKR